MSDVLDVFQQAAGIDLGARPANRMRFFSMVDYLGAYLEKIQELVNLCLTEKRVQNRSVAGAWQEVPVKAVVTKGDNNRSLFFVEKREEYDWGSPKNPYETSQFGLTARPVWGPNTTCPDHYVGLFVRTEGGDFDFESPPLFRLDLSHQKLTDDQEQQLYRIAGENIAPYLRPNFKFEPLQPQPRT